MYHPFQNIVATSTHIFTTVQNHLKVFEVSTGVLVGSWTDSVSIQDALKKRQIEKLERTDLETTGSEESPNEEADAKRTKTNTTAKLPKIPVPGPGAPPIYNYIRGLKLSDNNEYLIAITDSDKSIIIFRLDFSAQNCLKLIKRQVFPKRPCSISIADENQNAIIGDKFGDVYRIGIDGEAPVPEKNLTPILGHVSMLTQVLMANLDDKQYILTADRDEHIKVSYYPKTFVVKHWLFGHDEFISSMIIPEFHKQLLITGGGDDSIYLWNWLDNKLVSSFNFRSLVEPFLNDSHYPPERFMNEESVRESTVVKLLNVNKHVVVLLENVKCLLSLSINDDLSLSFDTLLKLDTPLIDIAKSNDTIIGCIETSDTSSKSLQSFKYTPDLSMVESEPLDSVTSSCRVATRADFYPLYTMNSLRKRSEH